MSVSGIRHFDCLGKWRTSSRTIPHMRNMRNAICGPLGPVLPSELYIHGRLTPAQKVKPNMAEFEGVLVRHPQSSTCTAVRVIIPCPVNPKYTNLILGIRLGLGLGLGLDQVQGWLGLALILNLTLILTLIPRIKFVYLGFTGHGIITALRQYI